MIGEKVLINITAALTVVSHVYINMLVLILLV